MKTNRTTLAALLALASLTTARAQQPVPAPAPATTTTTRSAIITMEDKGDGKGLQVTSRSEGDLDEKQIQDIVKNASAVSTTREGTITIDDGSGPRTMRLGSGGSGGSGGTDAKILVDGEASQPGQPGLRFRTSGGDVVIPSSDRMAAQLQEALPWSFRPGGGEGDLQLSPREGPSGFLGMVTSVASADVASQLSVPTDTGLLVTFITKDGAASKAGLQTNDVLVRLDDQILIHPRQLAVLTANHKPGETVKFSILRKGKPLELTATLGTREEARTPGGTGDAGDLANRLEEARGRLETMRPLRTFTRRLEEVRGGGPAETAKPSDDDMKAQLRVLNERLEKLAKQLEEKSAGSHGEH